MNRLRLCRRHAAAPALHPVASRAGPFRLVLPALRNAEATTDGTCNPARFFAPGKPGRAATATSCQHFAAPPRDGRKVCRLDEVAGSFSTS